MLLDRLFASPLSGGIVMFTRSPVPYKHGGIRIDVLCPEVMYKLCVSNQHRLMTAKPISSF